MVVFVPKKSSKISLNLPKQDGDIKAKMNLLTCFKSILSDIYSSEEISDAEVANDLKKILDLLWYVLKGSLGLFLLFIVGLKYSDNLCRYTSYRYFFSNNREALKELLFEPEEALYYSFYKQLTHAPSFFQGISDLVNDSKVEYGHTINILKSFFIVPELIYSWFHRLQINTEHTGAAFYAYCTCYLHGFYLAVLYALAWHLSDSFFGGLLASLIFVINRKMDDISVLSRDNFSLPLFVLKLLFFSSFFKGEKWKIIKCILYILLTMLMGITSPFSLCLISSEIFCMAFLHLLTKPSYQIVLRFMLMNMFGLSTSLMLHNFTSISLISYGLATVIASLLLIRPYLKAPTAIRFPLAAVKVFVLSGFVVFFHLGLKKFYELKKRDHQLLPLFYSKPSLDRIFEFDAFLNSCIEACNFVKTADIQWASAILFIVCSICILKAFYSFCVCSSCENGSSDLAASKGLKFQKESPEPTNLNDDAFISHFIVVLSLFWIILTYFNAQLKVIWLPLTSVIFGVSVSDFSSYKWLSGSFLHKSPKCRMFLLNYGRCITCLPILLILYMLAR